MNNLLERVVTTLGVLLVVALLGYLAWTATRPTGPPDVRLEVETGPAEARPGGRYAVPLTVRNTGRQTASEVVVELVLSGAGGEERAQLSFPFVPRQAARQGWAEFTRPPAPGQLRAGVVGYTLP